MRGAMIGQIGGVHQGLGAFSKQDAIIGVLILRRALDAMLNDLFEFCRLLRGLFDAFICVGSELAHRISCRLEPFKRSRVAQDHAGGIDVPRQSAAGRKRSEHCCTHKRAVFGCETSEIRKDATARQFLGSTNDVVGLIAPVPHLDLLGGREKPLGRGDQGRAVRYVAGLKQPRSFQQLR